MKKTVSLLLIFTVVLLMFPHGTANAEGNMENNGIIPLEDGSYIVVTRQPVVSAASGIVTDSIDYTYYTSSGSAQWRITLIGTFTYTGTTSTCTSSNCYVDIFDSAWYVVSKSATKSGDTAYATVTMGRKVLGITVSKKTYDITLTCDKDGNVS